MAHRVLQTVALLTFALHATAMFGKPSSRLVIPSISYELNSAVLNSNAKSVAVLGCRQYLAEVAAALPSTVTVTLICDDQCNDSAGQAIGRVRSFCTMPNTTKFDMVVLDSYGDTRPISVHEFLHLLSAITLPKIMVVADWQAKLLDVLELPSLKLTQFSEGPPLGANEAKKVFSDIYHRRVWGPAGAGSGDGSTLEYTANIRAALVGLVDKYKITSILDTPCGSLHWMPEALVKMPSNVRYIGMDVACHLISSHRARFAEQANWDFFCADVCHQRLPPNRDLVFSRDAMQHLPLEYVFGFLSQVKASGAKYLLIGSYIKNAETNVNIKLGDYFPIDFLKPPFNVSPPPIEIVDEKGGHGKHMLLFEVAKMTWTGAANTTATATAGLRRRLRFS